MSTEGFDPLHLRVVRRREFNKNKTAALAKQIGPKGAQFRAVKDKRDYYILSKRIASDTGSSKPWRMTRLDDLGAAGHTYHDTPEDAIYQTIYHFGDIDLELREEKRMPTTKRVDRLKNIEATLGELATTLGIDIGQDLLGEGKSRVELPTVSRLLSLRSGEASPRLLRPRFKA